MSQLYEYEGKMLTASEIHKREEAKKEAPKTGGASSKKSSKK